MTDSIETSEDCAVHVPLTELEPRVNVANTEAFAAQASIGHLGRLVDELRAQRDELMAACTNALDIISTDRQGFVDCNALKDARVDAPIAHGLVFVGEDAWITPEDAEVLRDYDRAIVLLGVGIAKVKESGL